MSKRKLNEAVPMEIDGNTPTKRKRYIPKALKVNSWKAVYGMDIGEAICYVCNSNKIYQADFECGHIISHANNGPTNINNLIPICKSCNQSMSKKNLLEYVDEYHSQNEVIKYIVGRIINS